MGTSNYHVRCLPNNFPKWTFEKYGPSRADSMEVVHGHADRGYGTIFDGNGVPIWWLRDCWPERPKLLADGTLA